MFLATAGVMPRFISARRRKETSKCSQMASSVVQTHTVTSSFTKTSKTSSRTHKNSIIIINDSDSSSSNNNNSNKDGVMKTSSMEGNLE